MGRKTLCLAVVTLLGGCVCVQKQVRDQHQEQLKSCISSKTQDLLSEFVCQQQAWLDCRDAGLEADCAGHQTEFDI